MSTAVDYNLVDPTVVNIAQTTVLARSGHNFALNLTDVNLDDRVLQELSASLSIPVCEAKN